MAAFATMAVISCADTDSHKEYMPLYTIIAARDEPIVITAVADVDRPKVEKRAYIATGCDYSQEWTISQALDSYVSLAYHANYAAANNKS